MTTQQDEKNYVAFFAGGVATIRFSKYGGPSLEIFNPSGVDDGAYYPPTHSVIYGEPNLRELWRVIGCCLDDLEKRKATT